MTFGASRTACLTKKVMIAGVRGSVMSNDRLRYRLVKRENVNAHCVPWHARCRDDAHLGEVSISWTRFSKVTDMTGMSGS